MWMVFLFVHLPHLSLGKVNLHTMLECKITMYLGYVFSHSCVWVLILMTAEKAFTVLFPFKAKTFCTIKTAKITCSSVLIFWAIFHSQLFFAYKKYDLGVIVYCDFDHEKMSPVYSEFYAIFDTLIYSFLSFSLIAFFNMIIIVKLFKARKGNNTGTSQNTMSKAAKSTALMLVSVSICFLIFTIPPSVLFVLYELSYDIDLKVYYILGVGFYINHGGNSIAYALAGPKFRREGIKFLCSWRKGRIEPSITSGTSSEAVYTTNHNTTTNTASQQLQ